MSERCDREVFEQGKPLLLASASTLTRAGLSILKRAAANPEGARLKGSGQQASGRYLERRGLGRFVEGTRGTRARFHVNDVGRRAIGELSDQAESLSLSTFRAARAFVVDYIQGRGAA